MKMIKVLMAVLDKKAGTFIEHFVATNVIQAVRDFEQETIREGSSFNKYPDDFELCQIAEINTDLGEEELGHTWTINPKFIKLATARDLILKSEKKAGKAQIPNENNLTRNIEKNTLHSVQN